MLLCQPTLSSGLNSRRHPSQLCVQGATARQGNAINDMNMKIGVSPLIYMGWTPLREWEGRAAQPLCAANTAGSSLTGFPSTRAGSSSSPTHQVTRTAPSRQHACICVGYAHHASSHPGPRTCAHDNTAGSSMCTLHAPLQVERVTQTGQPGQPACAWTHAHDTGTARRSAHMRTRGRHSPACTAHTALLMHAATGPDNNWGRCRHVMHALH